MLADQPLRGEGAFPPKKSPSGDENRGKVEKKWDWGLDKGPSGSIFEPCAPEPERTSPLNAVGSLKKVCKKAVRHLAKLPECDILKLCCASVGRALRKTG